MATYTFDGTKLKKGSNIIANIRDNDIRKGDGSAVIGNMKGDDIRQGSGSTVIFNIKDDEIRQGTGSTKVASMKDVDNAIDGPGKNFRAALWLLCCR